MSILAIIPARSGSKGIPNKNFRRLPDGTNCLDRAIVCAHSAAVDDIVVSTDHHGFMLGGGHVSYAHVLMRPPELATDEAPMVDVVAHVLREIPGPPDQIVVLLQPTQPLRTSTHVREAIRLLQEPGTDSVVSVRALPLTHSPDVACRILRHGQVVPWDVMWYEIPTRRQDVRPAYIRDGTVYAFRRRTVDEYGSLYGVTVRPLIVPPEDTCELDTPADWAALEARLRT